MVSAQALSCKHRRISTQSQKSTCVLYLKTNDVLSLAQLPISQHYHSLLLATNKKEKSLDFSLSNQSNECFTSHFNSSNSLPPSSSLYVSPPPSISLWHSLPLTCLTCFIDRQTHTHTHTNKNTRYSGADVTQGPAVPIPHLRPCWFSLVSTDGCCKAWTARLRPRRD